MSANTPQSPHGGPEYLGSGPGSGPADGPGDGSGPARRWGVLGGAAVAVVAVVGLGGWGAVALLAGGSQPADAVPASAVGYLSVDLDPSASQKVEAFNILKEFPGIEKELDIGDRDDLRRWVFEEIQADGECKSLDYDADIEPWIGDRIAVAGVPGARDELTPLVALQVSDREAAETGIDALAECGGADEAGFGYAFTGDYVLMAETGKQADAFAAEAEEAALADDESFQEWTDAAGDPGIVTMYASAEAPGYLMQMQNGLMAPMYPGSYLGTDGGTSMSSEPGADELPEGLKELYADFEGMGAVVRFEDGAVEVELASGGVPTGLPEAVDSSGTGITTLPADTGAALSVAFSEGWLATYLEQLSAAFGGGMDLEQGIAEFESETGLAVPEDIEALLGDSVTFAVDSGIDFEAVDQSQNPAELPAGAKVHGDPDEIMRVVDKIRAQLGPEAEPLVVEEGDGVVAFGLNENYVSDLLDAGTLGDEDSFANVVPDADEANGVLYLDFDAGEGWAAEFADFVSGSAPAARKNVEPLDALGISSWVDGEVQHGLFRLTTD